jgi:transcriptional regulator with XRE-family HTH domain
VGSSGDYRYAEVTVNRYAEKIWTHHRCVADHPQFEAFGPRLRYWRETVRGFKNQGKFAEQVGIKQGSYSDLEGGKSKEPSAPVLLKLCDLLQLRPKYLLLGEGPAEAQYFQDISGPEAQLVMLFRQLPNDALRDSLLIYAQDMVRRAKAPQTAGGPPPAPRPPHTPAPAAKAEKAKREHAKAGH